MTTQELIDEKLEQEVLADFYPSWNLKLPEDSNGYEHEDDCEANSAASAAQIMYQRLPNTYKGEYAPSDLLQYIVEEDSEETRCGKPHNNFEDTCFECEIIKHNI